MADSAAFNWSSQVTKNGDTKSDSHQVTYTPTSVYKATGDVRPVTNSWVAIPFGAATTVRRFWIINLDAAISIDVSTDNAGTKIFATVLALESMPPLPTKSGVTYYWKTSSGSCSATVGFDGNS